MSASEIERAVASGFGETDAFFRIERLQPGSLRLRLPYKASMRRPGESLSGPALFTTADLAMYALVLAHIGPQLMAVTAQLNIHFLRRGTLGDIVGEANLLKLGRTLAVMEVRLYSADEPSAIAHVTGSYGLPRPEGKGT